VIKFSAEEAEMAVIGSILCAPETIRKVKGALRPEHFRDNDLRELYEACLACAEQNAAADLVLLSQRCKPEHVDLAIKCLEQTPSSAHIDYYAALVVEWAARRQLNRTARNLARVTLDPSTSMHECVSMLESMQDVASGATPGLVASDTVETRSQLAALIAESRDGHGWTHGVPGVAIFVPRILRGQVITIGGRSRHCKTALALAITRGTLAAGGSVVYASEEPEPVILARLVSQECNVPYGPLLEGQRLPQELERRFEQYADRLAELWRDRLWITTEPGMGMIELAVLKHRPWLLVVDTIQRMGHAAGASMAGRSDLTFGGVMLALRRLAVDCRCAVLVLSQVKYGEGRPHAPTAADFRETREIIEQSDTALTVFWPRVEDPYQAEVDPDGFGRELHIGCVKRRTGSTGNTRVLLDPTTHVLSPYVDRHERG